jgi:hypothetical protein
VVLPLTMSLPRYQVEFRCVSLNANRLDLFRSVDRRCEEIVARGLVKKPPKNKEIEEKKKASDQGRKRQKEKKQAIKPSSKQEKEEVSNSKRQIYDAQKIDR